MADQPLAELEAIPRDNDFLAELEDVADRWRARDVGLDGVEAALAFVEAHPDLDYGAPGPLVHFAEAFHRKGYEAALLRSFARRPTLLTAWMLNRVINGTRDDRERDAYVTALERAGGDPSTDPAVRAEVSHYLKRTA